jgi:hypothetical protein
MIISHIHVQPLPLHKVWEVIEEKFLFPEKFTQKQDNTVEQSHWQADSRSVGQGIPRLLWNLKLLPCSQELATRPYSERPSDVEGSRENFEWVDSRKGANLKLRLWADC